MSWEEILKISAGERADAERYADSEDLNMENSETKEWVLVARKTLKHLMGMPKTIEELRTIDFDLLDNRLTNIENELNKNSPNSYKLKRMKKTYLNLFNREEMPYREYRAKLGAMGRNPKGLRPRRGFSRKVVKQDNLNSGFKNNQENYETVLEAIERLMGLKDSITRGMKESEDEQINEDEMRKIAMALNKAAQQLESYY